MGAKQRGQKRGQGTPKAAKGSLKGSPLSQRKGNSSVYVPNLDPKSRGNALLGWQEFAQSSPSGGRHGFSMSEQARNTERHVFGWGATKLRDNAIAFVSAGHLNQEEANYNPDKKEGDNDVEQDANDEVPQSETALPVPQVEPQIPQVLASRGKADPQIVELQVNGATTEGHTGVVDTTKAHQQTDFGPPRQRSLSSSSSGSEQIVFAGRSNASRTPRDLSTAGVRRENPSEEVAVRGALDVPNSTVRSTQPASLAVQSYPISAFEPSSAEHRPNRSSYRRRGRRRPQEVSDEEEALMQDYIANMAMEDSSEESAEKTSKPVRKNEHFRFYEGSGLENMKVQIQSSTPKNPQRMIDAHDLDQAMDWNSDDLELFDNVSTSEDEVDDIEQVLRSRERTNGVQFLVTSKGCTTSDAKWIPAEKLRSESALKEIQIFEEIQAMELAEDSYDEDEESTDASEDEALNDLVDHIESEDDENARILAHTSRMTDEQIAQALAKQEELGLGSDELMLFSGDIYQDEEDLDVVDAFGNGDDFVSFSMKQHTSNRTRSKRNKKQRDSFPSASAFADALDEDPYGGFDVMDFDRPSLRPRKKGRKSDFPFELEVEDEELKDQLVSTWMKDREKKAQRKRDREEARQAAIYDAAERGDPAVIKAEIRRFLCQEIEVLRLAPMEAHVRASVHRLAKALRLNSHSEGKDGKGAGRYPVLTKTARTPSYTIESIWEVDALLNTRKFFPKSGSSYKVKSTARATVTRVRRTGGVQGASYMNGEVVGGSAPEIGSENKGRAMLEKMGWTSGMGIGAVGNKGSVDVIKHIVKTTKAGLG